jgi:hypothetical protein
MTAEQSPVVLRKDTGTEVKIDDEHLIVDGETILGVVEG